MVKKLYAKIKYFYEKYERLLLPAMLVFGVIFDFFTFASIKTSSAFAVLGLHILFAGTVIAFLNAYQKTETENRALRYLRLLSPLAIQFSFGALLSASFIFYFFSGSLYVSWPFILVIIVLMISNEVFRKYYLRPIVQVSIFYFLLFSTIAIVLPYSLEYIGAWVFLLSGFLSLVLIFGYIKLLERFVRKLRLKDFAKPIILIFIFVNALYFSNIIPPIPLSLKDSVVAHNIERVDNAYYIIVEEESFWERLWPGKTIHKTAGEKIAVFTSVFAPGKLRTDIAHHWQHKESGKWVSKGRFPYEIAGGRREGFRGYSLKSIMHEGHWRVNIETARGQVIGRVKFKVEQVDSPPDFEIITR